MHSFIFVLIHKPLLAISIIFVHLTYMSASFLLNNYKLATWPHLELDYLSMHKYFLFERCMKIRKTTDDKKKQNNKEKTLVCNDEHQI